VTDTADSRDRPDDLIAFLDESRKPVRDGRTGRVSGRGDHYVVVAAVVWRQMQTTAAPGSEPLPRTQKHRDTGDGN